MKTNEKEETHSESHATLIAKLEEKGELIAKLRKGVIQEAIYSVEADTIGEALDAIGYERFVDYGAHQHWMTHTYNENFGTWDIAIKHSSWIMETEELEMFLAGYGAYSLGSQR